MKCLHPIALNMKDKPCGIAYEHILHDTTQLVPCGKCYACHKNKQNEWVYRLSKEHELSHNSFFVTLTYSDRYLTYAGDYPTLQKEELKAFFHRFINETVRLYHLDCKDQGIPYQEYKKMRPPTRYFAVGEYGEKFDRPHYHFCLFDFVGDIERLGEALRKTWLFQDTIIDIRGLNGKLIRYCTKYMLKKFDNFEEKYPGCEKPFRLMSKGLGLKTTRSEEKRFALNPKPVDSINGYNFKIPLYLQNRMLYNYYKKYYAYGGTYVDFLKSDYYRKIRNNKLKKEKIRRSFEYLYLANGRVPQTISEIEGLELIHKLRQYEL